MVSSSDVQRLYLQAILSRGLVSEALAKLLWKKCLDAVSAADNTLDLPDAESLEAWNSFIAKVNKSLDEFSLDFRRLSDESTGKPVYVIVNAKSDEIAQLATDYTPAEIAYYKALVERIMLAPRQSFSVSSLGALREVGAIKPKVNMTKAQAENVLASFAARGWLLKGNRGRYSLSTRSIAELSSYLKTTYPEDVIECSVCNQIMTRGIACSNSDCANRLHPHCFVSFRKVHSACTQCGKDWPADVNDKALIRVGEGASKDGDDAIRRVRVQSPESSDEDEGEPSQAPSSQQPPQRSQRIRVTRKQDKSMDVDEEDDEAPTQKKPTRSQAKSRR